MFIFELNVTEYSVSNRQTYRP